MKLFVLLSFLFSTIGQRLIAIGCLDTLPPVPQLHASLDTHHAQQLAAQLAEFDATAPDAWMNYVPSFGIGYTPAGQPRPTLSFSLAQIFTARRQRRDIAAKRRSIQDAAKLEIAQLHSQLSAMLQQYDLMKTELATMRQITEIDDQLYQLASDDYEDAKLAPVQFLPKRKAWLEQGLEILRKEMELNNMQTEILGFAHVR